MAGTPVGDRKTTPTFPASSPQSDQAGSSSPPEPSRGFCLGSLEFALKADLVHRLLDHVIDVGDGVAAWLEVGEREPPPPPAHGTDAVSAPPWITESQDAALRGLCIASLQLVADQARRLSGWSSDQQRLAPELGEMVPRRRRPKAV